jgi:tetratricopeptide (TPR) repeat protein
VKARQLMAEAKQTTNPMRLLVLGWEIKSALDEALKLAPHDLEVRLDRVRYFVMTPGLVGGSISDAREEAAEIAKRDPALGAFARGYIAYREKEYGSARRDLQEAAKAPHVRERALTWLGWLSQETQQYATAFDAWTELDVPYEIGRTAVFCRCRLEVGEAALKRAPVTAETHYYLGLLHELRGNKLAARRELDAAWKKDKTIAGLKEARKRMK